MPTPEQNINQADQYLIEEAFQRLLSGYLNSGHRRHVEIIQDAFAFARKAHHGVRRRSGEPYILHPIAVATIVSQEIGLGSTSICAALLHDVVEDTDYTVDDIKARFGEKIAQIVDGLTKISGVHFGEHVSQQAENYRKLLLTMSTDIRVVLVKMADRLHNMRTLAAMPPQKQYKVAGETLYVYAPLAQRLGLFAIKTEFEDLAFHYEHPDIHASIQSQLDQSAVHREQLFSRFSTPIRNRLDAIGLQYEFKARVKSCYSIWKKMETKHIPLNEVYDLYAARIVFECPDDGDEVGTCWKIYQIITSLYPPHPDRTRDWLVQPKANGYRALHLTVMGPDGDWVEVQIRSRKMDEIAERGLAAHWKYKIGETNEEAELTGWLQTINDILHNPEPNAIDFLDSIKLNLWTSEITVFTPKGEMMKMPNGATVLDFAFCLHTELGTHCIAGKINHKLVPLSKELAGGDQVEIITSKTQQPKSEWINFVHTAKAKTRLRAALRHDRRMIIDQGEQALRQQFRQLNIELTSERLTKLISTIHAKNKDDLFFMIGNNDVTISENTIKQLDRPAGGRFSRLWRNPFASRKDGHSEDNTPQTPQKVDTRQVYRLITDGNHSNYKIATCCHPIPGDDVLGYVNEAGEVIVHKLDCPTAMRLKNVDGSRLVQTRWDTTSARFPASIHVEGIDRLGILQEIIYIISTNMAINMRRLNITAEEGVFMCDLDVLISDVSVVNNLCKRLKNVEGVNNAVRNN